MGFFVYVIIVRFKHEKVLDRKERHNCEKSFKIKTIDKKFADIPKGSKMLIVSPPIIDEYVKSILYGEFIELVKMRDDLAKDYQADKTCPVTTGIFLRIVSEASYEEFQSGDNLETITPFWRMVNPNSKLAGKLACGIDFIVERQTQENIIL